MLCACNAWCFSLHRRYRGGGSEKYTPYSIAAVLKNSPGDIFGKQFHPGQRLNELTRPIFSCRELDIFYAAGKISEAEYSELIGMLSAQR